MDLLKSVAAEAIDEQELKLKQLSMLVWNLAEPGGKEIKTSAAIRKFLKEHEFVVSSYKGMKTSFKAEWGQDEFGGCRRPHVGLLCRYDAYRQHGHLSGHNLVVEVTVGAALGLQRAIRASSSKIGKITVIGCPNSYNYWLIYLLNRKLFKDIDIVLSAIPGPQTVWNPVYLGTKTFRATYGTEAVKESSNNASVPAPETVTAAVFATSNLMSVQEHFLDGWKVRGAIEDGGRDPRETPTRCSTVMRMSGLDSVDVALMEKRAVPCLEAAATTTRCLIDLEVASKTIHSLINNTLLTYCLQLNAYHCGVLATPLKGNQIVLAPVDMGNLSQLVPTIRPMFYIGTDSKLGSLAFRDAAATETAHRYSVAMAKALAMTALDIMTTPATLCSVKEEHRDSVRRVRDVKFQPFASSASHDSTLVQPPLPPDFNTGWSRLW